MTTTHDDLSLFQISFCIDGNMEWSYINNEVVHQFQIAAQQSQVRYGTFKECRSRISGNRKFKGISITLDEKIFEQIFTCIKIRGALYDTRKTAPVRVYTYTPNISKILSEILACHFCDEMKKLYLQGKIFELIAVYCDEVICKSPTNDFGIRISVEDYNALLKAREFIGENFAHPLTIPIVAKAIAINEQKLKDGFKRCFGVTVTVGGVRFAKCARDFLHIFLSNRFLEMPKMGAKKTANLFQELLLCAMLWWHHLYLVFFMIYLFFTNLDNLNLPANSIASLRGEGEKVIEFSYPSLSYRLLPLLCRICKKKHSCIFVFPDFGQQASNNRRQFLGDQHNQICSLKTTQHFQKEEE